MKTQYNVNPVADEAVTRTPFALNIIIAIAVGHLLNDLVQAALPAIYPLLKNSYNLSFTEIGIITLTYQLTASLLQPLVGLYTDKKPLPYLMPIGMFCALLGILFLSFSTSLYQLIFSSALLGIASSTFHPEASRVARMASGGRFGFAQSTFQVGGNMGTALGPLVAAAIVIPFGQKYFAWLVVFTILAIFILSKISSWYAKHLYILSIKVNKKHKVDFSRNQVIVAFIVLAMLLFSKYIYMASITSYYTFYLMDKFHLSIPESQTYLFIFLISIAIGTFAGGPVGDKIGRKMVIWGSVLGAAPFTLLLPYANLTWTAVLSVIIGLVMSSAFAAIIVYAQELVPSKVGLISGIFFGLMFGISGIGAALLGYVADNKGIEFIYTLCSFLPLLGVLAVFLPNIAVEK